MPASSTITTASHKDFTTAPSMDGPADSDHEPDSGQYDEDGRVSALSSTTALTR